MNRKQWFVWWIGLMLLGAYLLWQANIFGYCNALVLNDEQMITCSLYRYGYAIPGVISGLLGFIFMFCGFLEPKKEKK